MLDTRQNGKLFPLLVEDLESINVVSWSVMGNVLYIETNDNDIAGTSQIMRYNLYK